MRVERRMQRKVITIGPDESIDRAQTLMALHGIRHLPVIEDGRLVGVLSEGDIRGTMVQQRSCGTRAGRTYFLDPGARVGEAMTPDPVVASPSTDIDAAARTLLERKIGCLPIVEGERLVGIITEADILGVVTEIMGLLEASSRIDIALGRDPAALERSSEIIRRHRGRIISVCMTPGRGGHPRVHHFRLRPCDLEPIAASLRRAGFRVLETRG